MMWVDWNLRLCLDKTSEIEALRRSGLMWSGVARTSARAVPLFSGAEKTPQYFYPVFLLGVAVSYFAFIVTNMECDNVLAFHTTHTLRYQINLYNSIIRVHTACIVKYHTKEHIFKPIYTKRANGPCASVERGCCSVLKMGKSRT